MWALNILDDATNLPNQAGEAYASLYHEEWRTREIIAASLGTVRAFLGDYSLRILQGSQVVTQFDFTLDQDLEITCTGAPSTVLCSKI